VVGVIGYNQIDQGLAKVSIGYWLAERWQGNGIITRACQALVHHAFEEMGMEKVEISAALENEPSRAVCERLGMQQEGITRRAERLADRVVDHVHYGLLRDDWLRLAPCMVRMGRHSDDTASYHHGPYPADRAAPGAGLSDAGFLPAQPRSPRALGAEA